MPPRLREQLRGRAALMPTSAQNPSLDAELVNLDPTRNVRAE